MVNEIVTGILIAGSFFILALIIQIVGTIFFDWRNHKRRLEYIKKELFFNKKATFFERITKEIENRLNAYSELKVLILIKNSKSEEKIKNIFDNLRNLEEMYPRGISLYFKNTKITLCLAEFIAKGTSISLMLPSLNTQIKKGELDKEFTKNLDERLDEILRAGEKLIFLLKEDLEKI